VELIFPRGGELRKNEAIMAQLQNWFLSAVLLLVLVHHSHQLHAKISIIVFFFCKIA
jgi:hypothetical protein